MNKSKHTQCKQNKTDCFAYCSITSNCRILDNTTFNGACPFYKTSDEYLAGLKKYPFDSYYGLRNEK